MSIIRWRKRERIKTIRNDFIWEKVCVSNLVFINLRENYETFGQSHPPSIYDGFIYLIHFVFMYYKQKYVRLLYVLLLLHLVRLQLDLAFVSHTFWYFEQSTSAIPTLDDLKSVLKRILVQSFLLHTLFGQNHVDYSLETHKLQKLIKFKFPELFFIPPI